MHKVTMAPAFLCTFTEAIAPNEAYVIVQVLHIMNVVLDASQVIECKCMSRFLERYDCCVCAVNHDRCELDSDLEQCIITMYWEVGWSEVVGHFTSKARYDPPSPD